MSQSVPALQQSTRIVPATLHRVHQLPEFALVISVTLLGALLRLALLDGKGLRYDEAITALEGRASIAEILQFHWSTTLAHPPVWALVMRSWSQIFGQSEFALRLPSALAAIAVVPLLWRLLLLAGVSKTTRMLATFLAATGPLLVLYGQDARMYSFVTALAVFSVICCLRVWAGSSSRWVVALVLANGAMIAFQYYSVLLVGLEGLFFLLAGFARRKLPVGPLAGLAVSVVPLLLWVLLAPSFQASLEAVAGRSDVSTQSPSGFLDIVWREMIFGAARYRPPQAAVSYALLPPFLLGLGLAARPRPAASGSQDLARWAHPGILLVLAAAGPMLISLLFPGQIASRYLLLSVPFIYVMVSLAVRWLWEAALPLGILALLLALGINTWGLGYYFGPYEKIGYRNVADYLEARFHPGEAVLLEAPRQHVLAKYYLPPNVPVFPVPDVELPKYFPVTAPPIVPHEVDAQLKQIMARYGGLWLILSGENEVDPAEFLQGYLMTTSYLLECQEWVGVRLCHFAVPGAVAAQVSTQPETRFGAELVLSQTAITTAGGTTGGRYLLAALEWTAASKPAKDYKLTARLVGLDGAQHGQSDSFPAGPLLPPATWVPGDRHTGHVVLPVPQQLQPGEYDLMLGLYDPDTLELLPIAGLPKDAPRMWQAARLSVRDGLPPIVSRP